MVIMLGLQKSFLDGLRNLSSHLAPFTSLSPGVRQQLGVLMGAESLPVRWEELSSLSLTRGLFNASFAGLGALERKIQNMVYYPIT